MTHPTDPNDPAPPRSTATLLLRGAVVALAYYATATLGLLIPYVGSHVSLVWLPTGIAIAAYLRWGRAMAWAVLVAAFAVNALIGGPLWMALGIAVGNTLGPLLSTLVMRREGFDAALTRRRDLGVFLVAVMVGMVVTASNGTAWLWLAGALPASQWLAAWTTWWSGDTVGALLGGIPLIAMTRASLREAFFGSRGAPNGALLGVVLLCGLLGFSPWTALPPVLYFPLLSLPLFITAVLALRAGVLAASLAVLVLAGAAAWGTAQNVGPFAGHNAHTGLLALWSYLTAQSCTSVLICGLTAELLATQRQQAALFQHANEGILLVGPDGRIGAANPMACALLGVQAAEVTGRPLAELPHGNGPALAPWVAPAALAAHARQYVSLKRADGAAVHVEVQTVQHSDARSRLQTQVMLRDITEQAIAEAELRRLTAIFDATSDYVVQTDTKGRMTYMNPAARQRLGFTPDQSIDTVTIAALNPPQTVERHVREIVPVAVRDGVWLGETVQWDAEHHEVPCSHMVIAHKDDKGRVERFSAIMRDITADKAAQLALQRSEATLRSVAEFNQTILRNSPVAMSVYAADGQCVQVNDACAKLVGASHEALLAQNFHDIAAWQPAGLLDDCKMALQTMQPQRREAHMITSFGKDIWAACELFPIELNGAKHLLLQVVDLSDQKRYEAELQQLAFKDPLTRLSNRRLLMERLQQALRVCKRNNSHAALLYIDLTKFKQLNDRYGHEAGDKWLVEVANRLQGLVRESDTVARIGGDEFVVLLEGLGPQAASAAASAAAISAKIRLRLNDEHGYGEMRHRGSASIGVRLLGSDDHDPDRILRDADQLMYEDKRKTAR